MADNDQNHNESIENYAKEQSSGETGDTPILSQPQISPATRTTPVTLTLTQTEEAPELKTDVGSHDGSNPISLPSPLKNTPHPESSPPELALNPAPVTPPPGPQNQNQQFKPSQGKPDEADAATNNVKENPVNAEVTVKRNSKNVEEPLQNDVDNLNGKNEQAQGDQSKEPIEATSESQQEHPKEFSQDSSRESISIEPQYTKSESIVEAAPPRSSKKHSPSTSEEKSIAKSSRKAREEVAEIAADEKATDSGRLSSKPKSKSEKNVEMNNRGAEKTGKSEKNDKRERRTERGSERSGERRERQKPKQSSQKSQVKERGHSSSSSSSKEKSPRDQLSPAQRSKDHTQRTKDQSQKHHKMQSEHRRPKEAKHERHSHGHPRHSKPHHSSKDSHSSPSNSNRPTQSPSTSKNTLSKAVQPNPGSPTASYVAEAERQAAIAAAMAANSSSMSPSVAAGIAKVLALPSIMSGKVGGMTSVGGAMTGVMGGSMAGTPTNLPHSSLKHSPSPVSAPPAFGMRQQFPRGANPRQHGPPHGPQHNHPRHHPHHQGQQQQRSPHNLLNPHNTHNSQRTMNFNPGPTVVALPPRPLLDGVIGSGGTGSGENISPPSLLQSRPMKPIRFPEVKIVFQELLMKYDEEGKEIEHTEVEYTNDKVEAVLKGEEEEKAGDERNESEGEKKVKYTVVEQSSENNSEQKTEKETNEEDKGTDENATGPDTNESRASEGNTESENKGDVDGTNLVQESKENGEVMRSEAHKSEGPDKLEPKQSSGEGKSESEESVDSEDTSDVMGGNAEDLLETKTDEPKEDHLREETSGPPAGGDSIKSPAIAGRADEEVTDDASTKDTSKSETENASPPLTTKEEGTHKLTCSTFSRASIPDSFLRFLLLVGKVPIIVENESQKQASPPKVGVKSPPSEAVVAAAQRAIEVLFLAEKMYKSISDRQRRSQEEAPFDATTSFFAACTGEISSFDTSPLKERRGVEELDELQPKYTSPTLQPRRGDLSASSTPDSVNTSIAGMPATTTAAAAVASASAVFSNVMSKVTKKQNPLTDMGKKWMIGGAFPQGERVSNNDENAMEGNSSLSSAAADYEVVIDQEMLGLTVENVLERTIIRTLLPDGAAKHAGAKVGSLIAKVGNVDTSNLTHFETIDELRQSQRPLKLTLRHIGSDVLRCAREEMGRLIRGRGSGVGEDVEKKGEENIRPWRGVLNLSKQSSSVENFDSVLRHRWPSKSNVSLSATLLNVPPPAMTRLELVHQAGKDLIRILALLVVGLEKELSSVLDGGQSLSPDSGARHPTAKELKEAIEITSKILLDYSRGHPDVDENKNGATGEEKNHPISSFYPVPPGRVQAKKSHPAPGPPGAKGSKSPKGKRGPSEDSPLLRIGDALQRTRSFLVESSSTAATALRWEIIDYLCIVLDLDTEQELSEKEAASSTGGGEASPINDLGSAGSILKLIVLSCSASAGGSDSDSKDETDESTSASLGQLSQCTSNQIYAGNCFLSVVHRLAASKSTSARISACSLGPVLWSHLDFPRQLQLRGVITRALHDVEVIVRKSTAAVLHEIAELAFDRRAVPWLVLMCERSMTDPEPQLRAAAMTLTWHLAEHLPNAFLGDASKGSRSIRRLPPRSDPTFMDVYLLQCKLLPVASNLAEDKIASVRLSVAAQCDRLCNALGEHWFSVIIDLLQALLSDRDERVRSEAILCMPRLVESVIVGTSTDRTVTVLESLLPLALKMQQDSSALVRSSLATATGELLVFLVGHGEANRNDGETEETGGYNHHKKRVDDTLIPLLQKLLQDSDPEVTSSSLRAVTNASRSSARDATNRIPPSSHSVTANVDDDLVSLSSHQSHTSYDRTKPVFIPVLSEEQVLRLLPTLSNLATSAQWRVRQSAVEIVPALLGCTFRHETRLEISKFCVRLMCDSVDAVRKTAAECLCLGGSSLARHGEDDGGEWIAKIVIPNLKRCSQSEDAKQRLLSLKMIEIIITNGLCPSQNRRESSSSSLPHSDNCDKSAESSMRMILKIAASHAYDRVANVRLNVGRVFGSIILLLERVDKDFVVTVLEQQLEEERKRPSGGDRDVIYFSQQALALTRSRRRD